MVIVAILMFVSLQDSPQHASSKSSKPITSVMHDNAPSKKTVRRKSVPRMAYELLQSSPTTARFFASQQTLHKRPRSSPAEMNGSRSTSTGQKFGSADAIQATITTVKTLQEAKTNERTSAAAAAQSSTTSLGISHFFNAAETDENSVSERSSTSSYNGSPSQQTRYPPRRRSASIESLEEDVALIGCAESTDEIVQLCIAQRYNSSRMPIVVSTRSISSLDFLRPNESVHGYQPASNRSSTVWSKRKPRHVLIDTPYRKQVRLQTCPTCHHAVSSTPDVFVEARPSSFYDNINRSAFDFSDEEQEFDDDDDDTKDESESAWSEDDREVEQDDEYFLALQTDRTLTLSAPTQKDSLHWGVAY